MTHPTTQAPTVTPPPSEACGMAAITTAYRLRIGDAVDPAPLEPLGVLVQAMALALMGAAFGDGHQPTGRPTLYVGDADRLTALGCPPPPMPDVATWLLLVQPMTCPTAVR